MLRWWHFLCSKINPLSFFHSENAGKTVAVQLQVKRFPFLFYVSLSLVNANGGL